MLDRWLRTTAQFTTIMFLTLAIAACGGGGDGVGSGGFLGNSGEASLDAVITLTATNSAGETDNELSVDNPLTVSATLKRGNGDPVADAVIQLDASLGNISPENGSALTDVNGVAIFAVTHDGTNGAGTLTASYSEDGLTVEAELNIQSIETPPTPPQISITTTNSAGETDNQLSAANPLTVTITLVTSNSDPITDTLVELETSLGTLSPENGSALTDATGTAIFELSYDGTNGAGTLTASFTDDGITISAETSIQASQVVPPETPQISITTTNNAGESDNQLSATNPLTVSVALERENGEPIADAIVELDASLGTVTPGNGSALTDANGIAVFELAYDGTNGAGTLTASYSEDGKTVTAETGIQASQVVPPETPQISITTTNNAGESDNQLSATNPLTVSVALERENGEPIADAIVELDASLGTVTPGNGSALTDANGIAVFELAYDGTNGAGTLTASYSEDGKTITSSFAIQAVPIDVAPAYLIELVTTDSEGVPTKRFSKANPLTVTVSLYSVEGEALAANTDALITLNTSIGTIAPSNGSTLTDENGRAQFTITAGMEAGAGIVTATYISESGDSFTRSQNIEVLLENEATPAFTLNLQLLDSSGNQTTLLSMEEPVTARVTLESSVEGASVISRIITLDSTIAKISPENGSSLTDASGVAEFLLEFDGTIGAGTVTANFASDDISLIETAVLEASSTAVESALSIVILDPDGNASNTLTNESPLTVQVSVTDREGNLKNINDEIIKLATELGTVSPANGQALTVAGVAEFTVQFDGNVGAGVVTATYDTAQGTLEKTANIEAQTDEESTYVLSLTRSDGSVTPTNPITITVNLRSGAANGSAVAGELVSLTSEVSDISPRNGVAVTDENGNATFVLKYNGSEGAGVVEASYTSDAGNTFSNDLNITSSQGLPAYQVRITSPVSGNIFDESGVDVIVNVASSVAGQNRDLVITLASDVGIIEPDNSQALTDNFGNARFRLIGDGTTGAGFVRASFTDADGNLYDDLVSVTMITTGIGGGGSDPSKIIFVSASPQTIALKGSGGGTGISEQAAVVFQVTDSTETGVGGQSVTFSLSTDLGGISLQNTTGATDAQGNVTAIVNSGTLPTPVRVEAKTTVPQLGEIGALSPVLNVSSGVPVDSRINLFYSPNQGPCIPTEFVTCTVILVSAFDRFGNPAVDGTVVNAVTNCGGVGSEENGPSSGSCVIGTAGFGRCEVTWLAGDMNPNNYRQCADGSPIEVMVYTLGEENFGDNNADGYLSVGDSFTDLGEPYLDENGSQAHELPEFFVDWNSSGSREPNTGDSSNPASSLYNGTACNPELDTPPADIDTNCSSELIYVWDTINPTP